MEFTRRMSFALLGGVCLRGAEVWTKDPASWDEKDIARLLSDSPWAQKVQVSPGGGGMGGAGGGMGGPGGGMGGAGGGIGGGDDPTGQLSGPGGGPGGGMGGGGRRGGGGMGGGGGIQPMTFTVRWMSALPLKQAILRSRMGKEADTSPQAKEYLERQESHYAVALIGPPRGGAMGGGMAGGAGAGPGGAQQDRMQRMNEHLKEATGLLRKGKPPIRPETVQIPQPGQNSYLFLFPRADAITLDDKEVEFATRLGPLEVKRKFKLKDMVYNGQLAL